jgi:uncharacterized protein YidB (DUF937 family)
MRRIGSAFWNQSVNEEFFLACVEFVQRRWTVSDLVTRMEQLGLHSVVRSWIYSSVPEPIFSDQLHALFGTGVLRAFAAKLDLSPRDLVRHLSQLLPRVMNALLASDEDGLNSRPRVGRYT